MTLSTGQLADYGRDGFLVLEGFVAESTCDRLRAHMDELLAGFDVDGVRTEVPELVGLPAPGLLLLNDFEALALSLPCLSAAQLRCHDGRLPAGPLAASAPRAVVGPGTGLGVGAVVPTRQGWVALPGEGGHATLAAGGRVVLYAPTFRDAQRGTWIIDAGVDRLASFVARHRPG